MQQHFILLYIDILGVHGMLPQKRANHYTETVLANDILFDRFDAGQAPLGGFRFFICGSGVRVG